jgi:hypothetical protein
VLVVTQGRAPFPDRLAGRGATAVNPARATSGAALPALTGAATALALAGGAWSVASAVLAAAMVLSLPAISPAGHGHLHRAEAEPGPPMWGRR